MNTPRDPDRLIHAFLLEGAEQLRRPGLRRGPCRHRTETTTGRHRPVEGSQHEQARADRPRRRRRDRRPVPRLPILGSPSSNVGGPASQPPATGPPEPPASAAPASAAPSPAIPPAADPDLHLADAWVLRVLPRGMDRTSGDRALDGHPAARTSPVVCRPSYRPGLTENLFLIVRLAADRQFHARRVGRRDAGAPTIARLPSRSPWTAPPD